MLKNTKDKHPQLILTQRQATKKKRRYNIGTGSTGRPFRRKRSNDGWVDVASVTSDAVNSSQKVLAVILEKHR
jgi:hypothetical protein